MGRHHREAGRRLGLAGRNLHAIGPNPAHGPCKAHHCEPEARRTVLLLVSRAGARVSPRGCPVLLRGLPQAGSTAETAVKQSDGNQTAWTVGRVIDDAEFANRYARAREAQADAIFEEILEIADDAHNDWVPPSASSTQTTRRPGLTCWPKPACWSPENSRSHANWPRIARGFSFEVERLIQGSGSDRLSARRRGPQCPGLTEGWSSTSAL